MHCHEYFSHIRDATIGFSNYTRVFIESKVGNALLESFSLITTFRKIFITDFLLLFTILALPYPPNDAVIVVVKDEADSIIWFKVAAFHL